MIHLIIKIFSVRKLFSKFKKIPTSSDMSGVLAHRNDPERGLGSPVREYLLLPIVPTPVSEWVSDSVPLLPKGPHFFQEPHCLHFRVKKALKVRAATIYLMLTIWILVMTKLVLTCTTVHQMKPRSVKVFSHNFSPLYFKELACLDKFSKNCFFGPHLCWRRSPSHSKLGPHFEQN